MKSTIFWGIGCAVLCLLLLFSGKVPDPPSNALASTPASLVANTATLTAQCRTGRTANPRGPEDAFVPYIISPRSTAVLSDRPTLRWNPIRGFEGYTVSLYNGDDVLWTKEFDHHRVPYPSDVAPLQLGIDYTLLVKAANGRFSTEEDFPRSFHLLSPAKAAVVRQAEALWTTTDRTETTVLLQTDFYTGSELYGEAIDTLESAIAEGIQSALIYRQLGDLYMRSNLYIRAEVYYSEAMARVTENLPEQARMQEALGELYEASGVNEMAVRYWTQAQESYEQLNNQFKVKEMQRRMMELTSDT